MPGKKDIIDKIDHDNTLTKFQKKTYKAILDIPKGETRTYLWVAKRIGSPCSARAVGNALNRNPYAPEVPCHRVIASDGTIGGYSGGVEKKKALLRKEGDRLEAIS